MRILLVDDDTAIVQVLKKLLEHEKYVVDVAYDGMSAWDLTESWEYDLILLDVMLPKLDGITFCRRLRERKNAVLVMLLTARDSINDKIMGLDSGADDYLVKPFDTQELVARIRALIRRKTSSTSTIITCGDISLDPNLLQVSYQGKILEFSRKEYLIVELFLRNQKRVYSCRDIVDHLWEFDAEPPNESTVRSHIKNIRRQLKLVGSQDLLETVYGQGYRVDSAILSVNDQIMITPNQQETLNHALAAIWETTKHLSWERLMVLENMVELLKSGNFNDILCKEAIENAHKLTGSLGMFGFDQGSALARKIEHLLESSFYERSHFHPNYQLNFLPKIEPLIMALHYELQIPQELKSQSTNEQNLPMYPINARILAVDDDPQILMTLKAILEPVGVQLTCLSTVENFWDTLKSCQPNFLILDINIPNDHEGLDLCQSIRNNDQWNFLPILFLSSCTDQHILQQTFMMGTDDLLTKPIIADELLTRIRNRCDRFNTVINYAKSTT